MKHIINKNCGEATGMHETGECELQGRYGIVRCVKKYREKATIGRRRQVWSRVIMYGREGWQGMPSGRA